MKKYVIMAMMLMFTLGLAACSNMHDDDGASMKHTGKNAHDRSFDIIR